MQNREKKLKLLGRSIDDVKILSALLQDSIIPGADMVFDHKMDEFVFVANRFCWELKPSAEVTSSDGKPLHKRRLCGVRISHVSSIQHYKWPHKRHFALFNLLALRHMDMAEHVDKRAVLQFEFSGGSGLRLKIDEIDIALDDLDSGYPTSLQPGHDL